MNGGKTIIYAARNLLPTRYKPEYLKQIAYVIPEIELLKDDENLWCVTAYKGKSYNEYGFSLVVDAQKGGEPVHDSIVTDDIVTLIEHINIPTKMFEQTRRSVLKYVGNASDEEAGEIIKEWFQTTS